MVGTVVPGSRPNIRGESLEDVAVTSHHYRYPCLGCPPGTTIEGFVNIIEATLARVPRPEGFVATHVVEVATGEVLASLRAPDGGPPADGGETAAAVAGSVRTLAGTLARHWADDDLEDLVVTTNRHHHLGRLMGLGGTDVLVLVAVDRDRANPALARHLRLRLEAGLSPRFWWSPGRPRSEQAADLPEAADPPAGARIAAELHTWPLPDAPGPCRSSARRAG